MIAFAITFIALVFGLHIMLVNIDVGLGVYIPLLKREGEKHNKPELVFEAKRLMNYYAATYATAGVFATAFTVGLLAFFPDFLWFLGTALLIPISLAIPVVALRLTLISAYWYSWDKIDENKHYLVGLLLASTSFLVPLLFRTVFAFLNTGQGVNVITDAQGNITSITFNFWEYLFNPTFWPLLFKTLAAAFAVTSFSLASLYTYRLTKNKGDKEVNILLIRRHLSIGIWLLFSEFIFGFWYLATLSSKARLKFTNVVGSWFGYTPNWADLSWLFLFKLLLVSFQVYVALRLLTYSIKGEEINFAKKPFSALIIWLGPVSIITVLTGELLNMLSHLPYFVVAKFTDLPFNNAFTSVNQFAIGTDVIIVTIIILIPLLIAAALLFYLIFTGVIGPRPEPTKEP